MPPLRWLFEKFQTKITATTTTTTYIRDKKDHWGKGIGSSYREVREIGIQL